MRRFPPPWTIEDLEAGFKVVDLNGQTLAYIYGHADVRDAQVAKALTLDEATRIASNIAKLPALLGKGVLKGPMTAAETILRFIASKEDDPGGAGLAVVVPTLLLPEKVVPLVSSLNLIAQDAERISVLRPIWAFWRLYCIRPRFNAERSRATEMLAHCYDRLKEPVEGASSLDNAWI